MESVTSHEPSSLEVFITVAVGRLFSGFYRTAVESLDLQGNERVLDFGSGAGIPARLMAGKLLEGGGQLTCVDVSEVWLETAQKRLGEVPNVTFHLGEISDLDIPDASHDVVFVHFVIHDIPASQRPHVMRHLASKLVAGGRLYIREPLNVMAEGEIRRLIDKNGLTEIRSYLDQTPLMGPTFVGLFARNGA
jgi:ubiquinone/menaquinone biosynthesis C-methylase UbiE